MLDFNFGKRMGMLTCSTSNSWTFVLFCRDAVSHWFGTEVFFEEGDVVM